MNSATAPACHLPARHQRAARLPASSRIDRACRRPAPPGAGSHIPSSTRLRKLPPRPACRSGLHPGLGQRQAQRTRQRLRRRQLPTGGADPRRHQQRLQRLPRHRLGVDGHGGLPDQPVHAWCPGAQYKGFQTRPQDHRRHLQRGRQRHTRLSGDCSAVPWQHHRVHRPSTSRPTTFPTPPPRSAPAATPSSDYAVMPTLANIHANAPSTTSNCAQCHGAAAASFAIPPTTSASSACRATTSPPRRQLRGLPRRAGLVDQRAAGGQRREVRRLADEPRRHHDDCASLPRARGQQRGQFAGIARIVGMPPTSPAGASSHIPSAASTCEACHLASVPSGLIAASATTTAPGTAFATPAPTGVQIHRRHQRRLQQPATTAGLGVDGRERLPDRARHADRRAPRTRASRRGRGRPAAPTSDCRPGAPGRAATARQCHASTTAFTAWTSRPTTSPTPPPRSAPAATPAATTPCCRPWPPSTPTRPAPPPTARSATVPRRRRSPSRRRTSAIVGHAVGPHPHHRVLRALPRRRRVRRWHGAAGAGNGAKLQRLADEPCRHHEGTASSLPRPGRAAGCCLPASAASSACRLTSPPGAAAHIPSSTSLRNLPPRPACPAA